jgi:hypothetical protein
MNGYRRICELPAGKNDLQLRENNRKTIKDLCGSLVYQDVQNQSNNTQITASVVIVLLFK